MRARHVLTTALLALAGNRAAHAIDCPSLQNLQAAAASVPITTFTRAEPVTVGSLTPPYGDTLKNLPSFCRVAGVIRPTPDSSIHFEVWLPLSNWNGRLLGVGNGGFAGSINYDQMRDSLRQGYATASTDTGHQDGPEDASWAFHHPEKIADWGYRALHLTTLLAKQVVTATYGHPAQHAYFDSCSNGGREGLMEAQRFPEDYDGILDGAPANNFTRMFASGIDLSQTLNGDPAAYISTLKLPAIHRKVLEACDLLDGVKDGIVSDPTRCHFDPAVLQCPASQSSEDSLDCLTPSQISTLRKLYAGGSTRSGQPIFPGFVPGSELPAWPYWVTGAGPGASAGARYTVNLFRYMVTNDPKWDVLTADVDTSLHQAQVVLAKTIDATDPNLRAFVARGGKLILYHGWNDSAIAPRNTIAYWNLVRQTLGDTATEGAIRLYMAPGMEHCSGGPGPSSFGQLGMRPAAGPGSGMLDQLEAWVETGTAPGPVLAAKFPNDDAPPTITRPLCPYPQTQTYRGAGDPNHPENFTCSLHQTPQVN